MWAMMEKLRISVGSVLPGRVVMQLPGLLFCVDTFSHTLAKWSRRADWASPAWPQGCLIWALRRPADRLTRRTAVVHTRAPRGATRRTIDQKRLAPWRTSSPRSSGSRRTRSRVSATRQSSQRCVPRCVALRSGRLSHDRAPEESAHLGRLQAPAQLGEQALEGELGIHSGALDVGIGLGDRLDGGADSGGRPGTSLTSDVLELPGWYADVLGDRGLGATVGAGVEVLPERPEGPRQGAGDEYGRDAGRQGPAQLLDGGAVIAGEDIVGDGEAGHLGASGEVATYVRGADGGRRRVGRELLDRSGDGTGLGTDRLDEPLRRFTVQPRAEPSRPVGGELRELPRLQRRAVDHPAGQGAELVEHALALDPAGMHDDEEGLGWEVFGDADERVGELSGESVHGVDHGHRLCREQGAAGHLQELTFGKECGVHDADGRHRELRSRVGEQLSEVLLGEVRLGPHDEHERAERRIHHGRQHASPRRHCGDPVVSGQREEELLHLRGVVLGVLVEDALAETGRDDGESRAVQSLARGGNLGDDLAAVTPLLDHGDDAADLALYALESFERRYELCGIDDHGCLLHLVPRRVSPARERSAIDLTAGW